MRTLRCLFYVCLLLLPLQGVAAISTDDALLDRLVQPPFLAAVSLSSDGHFLSGLKREGENSRLVVWNVASGFETADKLPYTLGDIDWLSWVGGGRLLLSLKENGLVIYDAHIRRLRPLIDSGGPRPDSLPPVLVSALMDDPTAVLLQWEDDGVLGYPAVYRVDLLKGTSSKIVSGWKPVVRWWASPEGEVHLGEGFRGRRQILYTRSADGGWQPLFDRDYFDGPALSVLAVEAGGGTALVLSAHASDTRALWRMDVRTGDMLKKLAGHERFDMAAAVIDPVTDLAVGAAYVADGDEVSLWQADYRALRERVAARLGPVGLALVTSSRDGRRRLFRVDEPTRPTRYVLFDTEEDTLVALPDGGDGAGVPAYQSEGVWIPISRKIGAMHAVLSTPKGGTTGRAVLLLHGGPVRRVAVDYDPLVAWLTAGGYTVLQPNFRGSSGFGESWRRAGYAEWGRVMQEDVRTAIDWLVAADYAVPGHLCAMGGSYGGYAALMSAINDDDVIACAISLNGVTSIPRLVGYLSGRRFSALSVPRIAGGWSDKALRRRSPLHRAAQVGVPVLLLHATEDANVPFEHGRLMATALEREEKSYEFITLGDAGHRLVRESDRRIYYREARAFLDRYTKGRR